MSDDGFHLSPDLLFNRERVDDPAAYAAQRGAASWLFLVGDEFASMPGGISYAQVQAAVSESAQVASDPPRVLTLALAREQVAALDALPRPTLVTCRTGPRASATTYLYAGLKAGAGADEVLAAAEADDAPFCAVPEFRQWVRSSLEAMRDDNSTAVKETP